MKNNLINYDKLADLMEEYDQWMKKKGLDLEEQFLLIKTIGGRLKKKDMNLQAKDAIGNLPFGELFKKAGKHMSGKAKEEQ